MLRGLARLGWRPGDPWLNQLMEALLTPSSYDEHKEASASGSSDSLAGPGFDPSSSVRQGSPVDGSVRGSRSLRLEAFNFEELSLSLWTLVVFKFKIPTPVMTELHACAKKRLFLMVRRQAGRLRRRHPSRGLLTDGRALSKADDDAELRSVPLLAHVMGRIAVGPVPPGVCTSLAIGLHLWAASLARAPLVRGSGLDEGSRGIDLLPRSVHMAMWAVRRMRLHRFQPAVGEALCALSMSCMTRCSMSDLAAFLVPASMVGGCQEPRLRLCCRVSD